jgi:hypothetical protein
MDERTIPMARTPAKAPHADRVRPADAGLPLAGDPTLDGDVLAETIRAELRSDSTTAALAIEVEVWDRVVHLRGVVAAPGDKEAAESVAARANGVGLVANDLELRWPPTTGLSTDV